jgi:outer membrane protein, heavy metal efflux system
MQSCAATLCCASLRFARVFPAVLVLASAACAEKTIAPVAPAPTPIARDLPVYAPSGDAAAVSPAANPTGPLSLRDAVSLALLHNPELAAFAWEIRVQEARTLQAGRPPNPVVGVLLEDIGASGLGSGPQGVVQPQTTIQLSQLIELGGKRAARQQLAALNRDLAAWDYETARIDVLTRVTDSFVDVLAAQELVSLTEQTTQLVAQTAEAVGLRVTAGVVSPIEETKAEVALASVRIEAERARRTVDANRRRLASLWGSGEATFTAVVGDLRAVPALPPLVQLKAQLENNPDLARWAVEIAQRKAEVTLEESKRVPDVTVNAGYRRFTDVDSNALIVGATIALPIFDKNRAGVEAARGRVNKAYAEQRAIEMRVTFALAEAYRALSSAHAELTGVRTAVLPGAQQAFEAISEGYRLGRFGYLDVLDAQRTFVSAGGQYLRALAEYHKAAAALERLMGAPLTTAAVPPSTAGTK